MIKIRQEKEKTAKITYSSQSIISRTCDNLFPKKKNSKFFSQGKKTNIIERLREKKKEEEGEEEEEERNED